MIKTFIANGLTAIDIDKFKMSIKRTRVGSAKSLVIKSVSGSFSVSQEKCGDDQIDIDENLCIVTGKRIITGIEIGLPVGDETHSNYTFTATDVQTYGS